MKIAAVETVRLENRANLIWVRLHSDDGLIGLGETWFGAGPVEADIHDRIAPLLLGEDAGRIERLAGKLRPYVGFAGTGAEQRANSAVDVALWDLAGQAAGQPVCALLGGPVRERIPVYNTCAGADYVSKTADVRPGNFGLAEAPAARSYEDLDAFLNRADELAADLLESGIEAMKIWPFDFAAGAGRRARHRCRRPRPRPGAVREDPQSPRRPHPDQGGAARPVVPAGGDEDCRRTGAAGAGLDRGSGLDGSRRGLGRARRRDHGAACRRRDPGRTGTVQPT